MPIPCASPNSISLPGFICGCTPVSEFNQKKKKKKNSENALFQFAHCPNGPIFNHYGIVIIMSIEVQMTAIIEGENENFPMYTNNAKPLS